MTKGSAVMIDETKGRTGRVTDHLTVAQALRRHIALQGDTQADAARAMLSLAGVAGDNFQRWEAQVSRWLSGFMPSGDEALNAIQKYMGATDDEMARYVYRSWRNRRPSRRHD